MLKLLLGHNVWGGSAATCLAAQTVVPAEAPPNGHTLVSGCSTGKTFAGREIAAEMGVRDITAVLATETDCRLPPNIVDLALMVDIYHELLYPVELMQSLGRDIKLGGQIAIVECPVVDPTIPFRALH